MKRLVLAAVILFVLPWQSVAAQSGVGEIKGQLINKSKEGGSVAGINLKLSSYNKTTPLGSVDGKTDADGKFTFSGLVTEKGYSYQVIFTYQGADYYSDRIWYDEGQTSKAVEVPVYNPTTSDDAIRVGASHTIIYASADGLLVKEFYLFRNDGDRTFVGSKDAGGGKKETLKFSLPPGATGLQYGQSLSEYRVVKTSDGFVDTAAVEPGERLVGFSYTLRGTGAYLLSRSMAYSIDNIDVLIEDKGVVASSTQLGLQDPVVMKEGRFILLTGQNLPRGATHEVAIRVTPKSDDAVLPLAAAGRAAVLSVGAVVLLVNRRRQSPTPVVDTSASERELLLEEIAALDDDFEAGTVSQKDYQRLRSEKKARLVELTGRRKAGGN